MALICMAVYDTEDNGRSEYTQKALVSIRGTVDLSKHRIAIIDNNSCDKTKKIIADFVIKNQNTTKIILSDNLGTAKAINLGIKLRRQGEHVIKMDNDCLVNQMVWVDEMEEVIKRDKTIGIVGLKRKDVDFDARHGAVLVELPHKVGERWINVETGGSIMGTCTMFNSNLIDKIGYMFQIGVYGFDDTLYALRSELAGFWNCYLPHIDIDHIDTGINPYTQVKHAQASAVWDEYHKVHDGYVTGNIPLYFDGGFGNES